MRLRIQTSLALVVILAVAPCCGCGRDDATFGLHPSAPAPVIPDAFGVNIHFTDPQPGEMKMLAESGVRWVRMDFKWDLTETVKARYDFAIYDRLMSAIQPFGIRALFILDYGNPLYDNGGPPRTHLAKQAFANWAVAAARHFAGRGVIWETYNEPNNRAFWQPQPNVGEYASLAMVVARAFRASVPQEKLIGPAISEMDFHFMEGCLRAGLLEYWSAVSVHPYLRGDPEAVVSGYNRLRMMIDTYKPKATKGRAAEIPIFSSEWGYSSVWPDLDEEKQGQLLARQWLTNIGNGIPLSIWYDWRDDGQDPNDPEHHFGIVSNQYYPGRDPVFDPKPAYVAARTLTTFFRGYRFEKRLTVGSANDYVLLFRNGVDVRVAAWTTGANHDVVIPLDAGNYAGTQHTGGKTPAMSVVGTGLTLRLTQSPLYLCRVGNCS